MGKRYIFLICPIGQINMALHALIKFMKAKTVLVVSYVLIVRELKKIIGVFIIMKNETTGEIYGKRKIDVEPVFGFLKANLGFARFSVRSKQKVEQELGFAFMAVNLRKFTAMNRYLTKYNQRKNSFNYHFVIIETVF